MARALVAAVDARVERDLGGGGEVAVHDLAVEVDDRHHLGRDLSQVGSGRGDRDQVSLAGGDVARRADDEPFLGQVTAGARHRLSFLCQEQIAHSSFPL